MKEIPVIQGSPEWWALRCGIPTASEFGRIITPTKGEYAAGAEKYAAELVSARLGTWTNDFQGTPDTERGCQLEASARKWFEMRYGIEVREAGFCLSDDGAYGASPDGFTPDGTPVEIKCPAMHTYLGWLKKGVLPIEHKAQVHGEMWVTGAESCIFIAYVQHPAVGSTMFRVKRDGFTEKLGEAVTHFCAQVAELQEIALQEQSDAYAAEFAAAREAAIQAALKPATARKETYNDAMNRAHQEALQSTLVTS